ncbi:hydantoinase B/oxoprolinase family protein [Rhodoligotrophos ferricapiens]|uniref:hydantoinase B/oxoprolinase family protein n=1 Tax=Rhodoligotrophos ferricapiens TaxID=3069264 RepID=UPI00315D5450
MTQPNSPMSVTSSSVTDLPLVMRSAFLEKCPKPAATWPLCMGLVSAEGNVLAQHEDLPIFASVLEGVARAAVARFGKSDWADGELYLSNDPYLGGLDLGTIVMLAPIFVQDRLAALAGGALRLDDIGAMRDDIFTFGREIMHQGVRLSGLRFPLEKGHVPEMLENYLAANIRNPELAIPALNALAAAVAGIRIDGVEAIAQRSRDTAHAAEAAARTLALAELGEARDPSGETLQLKFACIGNQIRVSADYTPIDREGRNASLAAVRAGILVALAEAVDIRPWALSECVNLEVPEKSRFNATYPAAVQGVAWAAFLSYQATVHALGRVATLDRRQFLGE